MRRAPEPVRTFRLPPPQIVTISTELLGSLPNEAVVVKRMFAAEVSVADRRDRRTRGPPQTILSVTAITQHKEVRAVCCVLT